MHRYTATLANEPNNPWRWTGDAHQCNHAARLAAAHAFRQWAVVTSYPMTLTVSYAGTPDAPIAVFSIRRRPGEASEETGGYTYSNGSIFSTISIDGRPAYDPYGPRGHLSGVSK